MISLEIVSELSLQIRESQYNPEAVARRCSVKKMSLEVLQNSQESTFATVSFLIKLQSEACNFIKKETQAQVFSCEFCQISKNTFSYRMPLVAASNNVRVNQGGFTKKEIQLNFCNIFSSFIFNELYLFM